MSEGKSGIFFWIGLIAVIAIGGFYAAGGPKLLHHDDEEAPIEPLYNSVAVSGADKTPGLTDTPPPLVSDTGDTDGKIKVQHALPRNALPMGKMTPYFTLQELQIPSENGNTAFGLPYYMRQPPGPYPSGKKYPLVIVLHDIDGLAPAAEYLIPRDVQAVFPSFVVVPALPNGWLWAFPKPFPDVPKLAHLAKYREGLEAVTNLVADLIKHTAVDPTRVYIVGCAEGGFGVFGAVLRHPELFAAAMSVNGGWAVADAPKMADVPIAIVHGQADTTFPTVMSRNMAAAIKKVGGKAYYSEIASMAHQCNVPQVYSIQMWQWMFSQHKAHVSSPDAAPEGSGNDLNNLKAAPVEIPGFAGQ